MNLIQSVIRNTREKMMEYARVKAAVKRQMREEAEQKNALFETLLDSVCAETGLRCENPGDQQAIKVHLEAVLLAVKRRKAEEAEEHEDADYQAWLDGKGR